MSFINALQPSFQAKRLEIERSIMNLQQRLLKRKQLDLQIEKQLLEKSEMHKKSNYNSAYRIAGFGYDVQRQLDDRLEYLHSFDPRDRLIKALEHQKAEIDYFTRLKQLQIQQTLRDSAIDQGRRNYLIQKSYNTNYDRFYPLDESGQILAKKYIDGTRVLEFNDQLKKSSDKLRAMTDRKVVFSKNQLFSDLKAKFPKYSEHPLHSTVKKYSLSSKKHNGQVESINNEHPKNTNIIQPTPIKLIENSSSGFNSIVGNFNHDENKKYQNTELSKIQQRQYLHESPIMQPKGIKGSRTKSTQPTNQYINVLNVQSKQFQRTKRPKSSRINFQLKTNRQKSVKSFRHLPSTQRHSSHGQYQPVQLRIRRQVQDRLRMSQQSKQILEIFYAKDVPAYLLKIYGKQDKFRKDLKQKICKIPIIQRKFDVGPVVE